MFMCHYGDTASRWDASASNSSTVRSASPDNIQQFAIQHRQYEKSSSTSPLITPFWFPMNTNDDKNKSSLLWMGQNLQKRKDDEDFIEIQYGETTRNLQEDYELYRV